MAVQPAQRYATEAEFQQAVIEAAHVYRWRVAHFRSVPVRRGKRVVWQTPVQADGAGFPDLVLVKPPRIIFAELKKRGGRLTDAQVEWRDDLELVAAENLTVETYVWFPSDWPSIIKALSRR